MSRRLRRTTTRKRAADTPPVPRSAEMHEAAIVRFGISAEDDPGFVQILAAILDTVVAESTPEIVSVIQINGWFHFKWLHFSGKAVGEVGRWKKELTLPPFNPKRVNSQIVLRLAESGDYREIDAPPIHVEQSSSTNLFRKLEHTTDNELFAWWTGDTLATGRAGLMIYSQIADHTSAWFASFRRYQAWRVDQTREISVDIVKELMARGDPRLADAG